MNRGISKRKIFYNEKDYQFFLDTIEKYKQKFSIEIIFYCLMPNHFHLITRQNKEKGMLEFISRIQLVYSKHFNWKYNRKGPVFEGRYIPKFIDSQEYLIELIKYLANNPVKAGLVKRPEDWKWMSLNSLPQTDNPKVKFLEI